MNIDIRPLTPDLWPDFEELFGDTGGCNGCWCMYWRIGSSYTQRPRAKNKADFRQIVKHGPPPGLLAFTGELAVGWCQLTPRNALPGLDRARLLKRVDEVPVWSISCFYVRKGYRKQGITAALIAAALQFAKQAKAPAVEAYPVDTGETKSASTLYTGKASTFARAGFNTIARHARHRPIMRYDLQQKEGDSGIADRG